MKVILVTILAGLAASTIRAMILELVSKLRVVHVDMIKAIGTLYHGDYYHSLLRGYVTTYLFGLVSAFIYLLLLSVFEPSSVWASAAFGGFIGFFHGCVVSFALTVIVDEDHPLKEFRSYGYEVVLYYWAAQIFYGIVVGAILGTVHPKLF
jgi:uncharacterized membrane protein YagU involved in acid resistance